MEIWLLRHAAAEDRADSGRDADRTLTEDGHRRAREVGRGLARLEPEISLVLTSPYARARQTAESAARALNLGGKIRVTSALEPHAEPDADEEGGDRARELGRFWSRRAARTPASEAALEVGRVAPADPDFRPATALVADCLLVTGY